MPPEKKEILFELFPKQNEFVTAALSGEYNFVCYGGAIRGGKTIALLGLFMLLSKIYPGSRWAIVRKDLPVIKRNLYPSWDKIKPSSFIKSHNHETHTVTFNNGSQIIFFPESYDTDKELNRWRGLEVNGIGFEEINECQQVSFYKAFERAGAYVIKNTKVQPKPIVVATCNPTNGWFKKLVYDPWKEKTLNPKWHYIQSRIYDNLPLLENQPHYLPSLKANLGRYEFEVFVEGNWEVQLQTGDEFLSCFDLAKHSKPVKYISELPCHFSIDNNAYPYIAVTVWQLIRKDDGWIIRQIDEIICEKPNNRASRAGIKIAEWLGRIKYIEKVHLYGDYSTKNTNTIDDDARSFFQIVNENIQNKGYSTIDKMMPHASPSSIADFINNIFEGKVKGLEIEIGENCKTSINDYIETKKDNNGNIDKKTNPATPEMPSHQAHGHLTDTFKDFIVQAFNKEYKMFLARHGRLQPGGITVIPQDNPFGNPSNDFGNFTL